VRLCVGHAGAPCKNGREPIWRETRVDLRNHVLDGGCASPGRCTFEEDCTNGFPAAMLTFAKLVWILVV